MRDIRTVNQSNGQMIESVKVLKRIGDISYRDFGVFSKSIFNSGKALITNGLGVTPSSGMTVSVAAGIGIQRSGGENFPFVSTAAQTITITAASGVARTDIIQAQVQQVTAKSDLTRSIPDPTTGIIAPTTVYRDIKTVLAIQTLSGTTTPTAATAGILTGTVAIATTIDLSLNYTINLADGEDGVFQEINLQGATPAATTKAEIIAAINAAVGRVMASISGNYIVLTGNGTGITSYFELKPPTANDATFAVFGLAIAGLYSYVYAGTNDWFKIAEIDVGTATTTITAAMIRDTSQLLTWASDGNQTVVRSEVYHQPYSTGWEPISAVPVFASAVDPTYTVTIPGDYRKTLSRGMRFQIQQSLAFTNQWPLAANLTDVLAARNGTITSGSASYTAATYGYALTLSGSQAVSFTDNANFHLGTSGAAFSLGFRIQAKYKATSQGLYQCSSPWTGTMDGILVTLETGVGAGNIMVSIANHVTVPVTMTSVNNLSASVETFVRITLHSNWMQIYLNGVLDSAQYMPTPTYTGTPKCYVGGYWIAALGNQCAANTQIYDMQIITGGTVDEQTTYTQQNAEALVGAGPITQTQDYIISAPPTYATGSTTLTIYGGTDFILKNGVISNPYYSAQVSPYGFNAISQKWPISPYVGTPGGMTAIDSHTVTSNRAIGTTYTNNQSTPINLVVVIYLAPGDGISLLVNGVQQDYYTGAPGGTIYSSITGVVPSHQTYSLSTTSGSPQMYTWVEIY